MKGSSPCTLITTGALEPRRVYASITRSVPLRCASEVITAVNPAFSTQSAMRRSSVATASGNPAPCTLRHTLTIISTPPILARGLPGKRVDA